MRDWLRCVDEIDKDCILQWEYLLDRKLNDYNEYDILDGMIDEMVLEWKSRREFFKQYLKLEKYKKTMIVCKGKIQCIEAI